MTTIEREGNIFRMTSFRPGKSIYPLFFSALFLGAFNLLVYKMSSVNYDGYIIPFLLLLFVVIFLFFSAVLFLIFGLSCLIPTTFILDEDGLWVKGLRKISLLCTWEEIRNVSYDPYYRNLGYRRSYRFSPRIEIKTSRRLKKGPGSYERDPDQPISRAWERRNLYQVIIGEAEFVPSDLRILYREIRLHWKNNGIRYQIMDTRPAPYQIEKAEAI